MRKITLPNGTPIQLPESLTEMNILAWNKFRFYAAQATNMGNDMDKVRANFQLFFEFQKNGRYEEAANWVRNAYLSTYCNATMHNPLQLAFAVLCTPPEGCNPQGLSESALKERLDALALAGLTQGMVEEAVFFFLVKLPKSLD